MCPSPCSTPQFNFPYETQQRNITDFPHPSAADAGWVQIDFSTGGTSLDQAWVDYSFEGRVALESDPDPGHAARSVELQPARTSTGLSGRSSRSIPTIPTGTGI